MTGCALVAGPRSIRSDPRRILNPERDCGSTHTAVAIPSTPRSRPIQMLRAQLHVPKPSALFVEAVYSLVVSGTVTKRGAIRNIRESMPQWHVHETYIHNCKECIHSRWVYVRSRTQMAMKVQPSHTSTLIEHDFPMFVTLVIRSLKVMSQCAS